MKIIVQMMLGFLVLILIMGVILASTLLSFNTIDEKEKEIQQLSIISSLSLSFNVENFNTQLEVWEYLYDPAEFRLEEFREHREDFNVKLHSLFEAIEQSNIILTPENKQIVNELKRDIPTVQENWEVLVNAIESGKSDQEIRQIAFEVENFFQESAFNYNIEKFSEFHYERLKEMQNEIEDLLVVTSLRILLLGIISLIMGIGFAFVMSRSISVPIKKLTETAQEIAEGNLSKKEIPVKGGYEICQLANSFNEMSKYIEKYQKEGLRRALAEKRSQDLEKIEKQKQEFISMITHELKSPLTPIIGFCEALMDPELLEKLTPKQLDAVETILKNATRLESIIGDLLDSHRLDLGKIKFNYTKVDVADLTNSVIKNFKKEIESKKIQFIVDVTPPMLITTDKQRVEQVLTNIVANSMDFVSKDTGKISVSAKLQKDHVLFTILDNGVGISPEDIDHIFDSFSQIETKLSRKHGGAGLGLAICRSLVTELGGKIWVESELGKGTSFYFTIAHKADQMDKSK